ncbi:hypothetical protein CAI16_02960 [Virgibacillus dokdonensis]|uniref:Uncharacterized protein n=1 Tax=Virgibacillus dokdonensis TaxID=302167 RepID=A0A3E0WXE4_9BACI|nr:hypothetical protein [Virgibacillus dokdonensis]RFA37049.1 hypothetical protein CAI16_02960 [Virgibacillus dokdonensis]
MSFVEITAGISVVISFVLAISTVVKNYKDNKRSLETQTPIFKVEKIQSFSNAKHLLLIRNVNDNFFVIKNVKSNDYRAECNYEGVIRIEQKKLKSESERHTFKGHCIEIKINSDDKLKVSFDIEGLTISGRKFIVRTPELTFSKRLNKTISIQDRYLEFIKK